MRKEHRETENLQTEQFRKNISLQQEPKRTANKVMLAMLYWTVTAPPRSHTMG